MATVEVRGHLGPHEVEIENSMYGIMLIPTNGTNPVMSLRVYDSKDKALRHAKEFYNSQAVVVAIKSTNA